MQTIDDISLCMRQIQKLLSILYTFSFIYTLYSNNFAPTQPYRKNCNKLTMVWLKKSFEKSFNNRYFFNISCFWKNCHLLLLSIQSYSYVIVLILCSVKPTGSKKEINIKRKGFILLCGNTIPCTYKIHTQHSCSSTVLYLSNILY